MFKSTYTTITTNIWKSLRKGSGWIIDSVIDHAINISKYNPLAGSSYIKLIKKLDHPRKGLINIPNIDHNECFKWRLLRYLILAANNPRKITKADKDFGKRFAFKDIKFPIKTRDIHKIEKKNYIGIRVFGYENKVKYPIYASKNIVKINMLFIDRWRKEKALCSYQRFQYIHV